MGFVNFSLDLARVRVHAVFMSYRMLMYAKSILMDDVPRFPLCSVPPYHPLSCSGKKGISLITLPASQIDITIQTG